MQKTNMPPRYIPTYPRKAAFLPALPGATGWCFRDRRGRIHVAIKPEGASYADHTVCGRGPSDAAKFRLALAKHDIYEMEECEPGEVVGGDEGEREGHELEGVCPGIAVPVGGSR